MSLIWWNRKHEKKVIEKIPFDYVPENFKSKGFNRSGRIVPKVNILKVIDFFKKRKKKRRKKCKQLI